MTKTSSTLEVADVMRRVREAVAKRNAPLSAAEPRLAESSWSGPLPALPYKTSYTLGELLAYSDAAFIQNAYAAVLRRSPDPSGFQTHLRELRSGLTSKVEILAALRWSPEGGQQGVHVDGLLIPYVLHKWRRARFIGPIISWCHAFLRLNRLAARPAGVEAMQAAATTELAGQVARSLQSIESKLVAMETDLRTLDAAYHGDMAQRLQSLQERLQSCQVELASHQQGLEYLQHHVTAHGTALAEAANAHAADLVFSRSLDPLYVAFEQRFRGEPTLLKERMAPYLEVLREAQVGTPARPLLDVGCGNGEWLELTRAHGFTGRGVDTNETFVELCRGRGLEVTAGDALHMIRAQPEGSFGAITAMHVAEHLRFEDLVALLDECRRALCTGGVLILETPNPENLQVASCNFYLDPTHRNPIPPETLRWIVEARGFSLARIERLTVARDMSPPPLLSEQIAGAASINVLLSKLHAAPDYAVIARRL